MKAKQVLVANFAKFENYSETTRGTEMINVSGEITFVCALLRRLAKKEIDLPKPYAEIKESGMKYFQNTCYPFPIKGEGRLETAIDTISCKKDRFTEAELKAFCTKVSKLLPEDWQEFTAEYNNAAKKAFGLEEKPAKSKTVKKTSPAKSKEVSKPVILMAERLIELGNIDWELIDESLIKKISDSCKQAKVTLKDVRAHFESLIPEPEETDENFELPF